MPHIITLTPTHKNIKVALNKSFCVVDSDDGQVSSGTRDSSVK